MLSSTNKRIITAIALLAVVLAVGWIDNAFLVWLFFGAVYLLAFDEALKLYGMHSKRHLLFYAALLWMAAGFFDQADGLFWLLAIGYGSYLAYTRQNSLKEFTPFIYPSVGMLFIWTLYREYGMASLFWLLAVVALSDIGAYVVGKRFGRRQFCQTSPNKTLEGVFGGLVVATLGGGAVGSGIVGVWAASLISLLVSLASIFGDLYESKLKRDAGVKDSGEILPGHGGVLDRIDGYLFGAVVLLVLLRGLV